MSTAETTQVASVRERVGREACAPAASSIDTRTAPKRSRADLIVRSVLVIPEASGCNRNSAPYKSFRRSMLISASRCTLTYVVFPFALPAAGLAVGVGPIIGIIIGVVALCCDVLTIRRFFSVDHPWRWHVAAVAAGVIALLLVLLVQDVSHLID